MPVTPFHFGPGALFWSASPRNISFLAFCSSNVVIDVESLHNMVHARPRIHTFLHTYVGATLAAAGVVAAFWLLSKLARRVPFPNILDWRSLALRQVVVGALVGAWSHVILDSIMHSDITPLMPFSASNPLHGIISLNILHLFCIASGAAALGVIAFRRVSRKPVLQDQR